MHKLNQDGAVSFLTVIFLAIVLSIMTLSFVRISINEQRQAIDDDLTTRAFYAAESGIEDAKRALNDNLSGVLTDAQLNSNVCTPAENVTPAANGHVVLSTDLDSAYTCQFIEKAPSDFKATLLPWESITIPLNGQSAYTQVRISWHEPDSDGTTWTRHGATSELPPRTGWGNNPAMLRVSVIGAPGSFGANFAATSVIGYSGFFNPNDGPSTRSASSIDQNIVDGLCDTSVTSGNVPACTVTLNSLPGSQRFLRIQSIYVGTHLTVELLDSSGNNVDLVDTQAVIDVTGRANDVYRRVEQRVSLTSQASQLPDVSIWSNVEICKNFELTDTIADWDPGDCIWSNP